MPSFLEMLSSPGEQKSVSSKRGLVLCWGEVCWGNTGEASCEPDLTKGECGIG